jgi:hypothetical protein
MNKDCSWFSWIFLNLGSRSNASCGRTEALTGTASPLPTSRKDFWLHTVSASSKSSDGWSTDVKETKTVPDEKSTAPS